MSLSSTTILSWIYSRLSNNVALAGLIGGVSPRIYVDVAPEGTLFPYILITPLVPSMPAYLVGGRAAAYDGIYLVRGVHQTMSYADPLLTIAQQIKSTLHGQYDFDNKINGCVLEQEFAFAELINSTNYRHLGGRFRVTTQEIV